MSAEPSSTPQREVGASLILAKVRSHPSLTNIDTDLDVNKPELMVQVQRDKASDLGLSIAAIGRTLETMLGGRPVTTFIRDGRAYNVVVKIQDQERVKPSDIGGLYIRGHDNQLIPLANVVGIQEKAVPQELHHHDKMRAVTISAGLGDGYSLGESLAVLDAAAQDLLPPGSRVSYAGESKEFKEATGGLWLTFVLTLLVVYLVLAAQFESFIHPLTILLAVPSALMGALLALKLFGGTLNIYSEIGMVILVGLVTKNAILIVEFANQLRARGIDAMRYKVRGPSS
jgi:multidrug efflux pump